MKKVSLGYMLSTLEQAILEDKVCNTTFFYKNYEGQYKEIVEIDLLRRKIYN